MLQVYRLYVGLSQANCPKIIDRNQVVNTIARCVDSFTVYDAQGSFRGELEDTLVITIAHDSNRNVKRLAYDLCVLLQQDGVGLEYDNYYYRVTRDFSNLQAKQSFIAGS